MKLKHTQAKKARRASAFHATGAKYDPHGSRFEKHATLGASMRRDKRELRRPKVPKTFGLQIVRTQRVRLKETGLFGAPIYKTIKHAATS